MKKSAGGGGLSAKSIPFFGRRPYALTDISVTGLTPPPRVTENSQNGNIFLPRINVISSFLEQKFQQVPTERGFEEGRVADLQGLGVILKVGG